jgi:UDP-2-acetamido-2,6-beta-L-arabino-hexul-4-ose reductase
MVILVTGAKGFMGKNLIWDLRNKGYNHILEYDIDTHPDMLSTYTRDCDFVFHLAGINRPKEPGEFMDGNFGFTSELLTCLKKHRNTSPVMLSSSIQASLDNPYGISKRAGEELLLEYSKETAAKVLIYRFPNVFGKWCRPNYNSVIATFCNNIANGLPIQINDSETELHLVYIDDILSELALALEGKENREGDYCYVPVSYKKKLGYIAQLINSFKESRNDISVPDMGDEFTKKLYSTYLSYIPQDRFSYPLTMRTDNRGSFTEFIRTPDRGQYSINISKPGVVKGQHWHHTKNEKFLVVSGKALVQMRRIDSTEIIDYHVSGDKMEVIDIPVGYTHNIKNEGDTDLIAVVWANEPFDPDNTDTYSLNV